MERGKLLIGGEWIETDDWIEVRNPYTREVIGKASLCGEEGFDRAISSALEAFKEMKEMPAYRKVEILSRIVEGIKERKEEFARTITLEAGKPIRDATAEVGRAINTFTIAMEEAKRLGGEVIPMDLAQGSEGRVGMVRRFPLGVVLGITPFNFPLNLIAHKVAPAIASGNTIIIKPSPRTPFTAILLAEVIKDSGLPDGAFNLIQCNVEVIDRFIGDERIKVITFTGSAEVGWSLKERAGTKKVILELGGNAGVIVHCDGDLDYASGRCVSGAFSYAGQVCISVQRVFVHRDVFKPFTERLVEITKGLKMGDPMDEETTVAPMIDEGAGKRTEEWIEEAVKGGARVLIGGKRKDPFFEPTILTDTKPHMKVSCMEVFAPIVIVEPYSDFEQAIRLINDSQYGLQAGVFTKDIGRILYAYNNIEVGGVIINDIPTYRLDHMPYGGIKRSGFGREGVRYAIEEMTELKLLVLNS